jgi:hypothetical protein
MDYRFAIRCWQDQAGSENAKANVFVDGTQVATEVEITATSADSPGIIAWESTGLTAPAADTSFDIKVVLVNEYYVDASTDRNINIDGIGYITKASDSNYKISTYGGDPLAKTGETTVTDFTDFNNYENSVIPTAVTGDQIASDWWSNRDTDSFYTVVVWGSEDTGATMTFPVTSNTCEAD